MELSQVQTAGRPELLSQMPIFIVGTSFSRVLITLILLIKLNIYQPSKSITDLIHVLLQLNPIGLLDFFLSPHFVNFQLSPRS